MAGITFSGMASGLPPNLVDQLIEAERIPVKQMEARKAKSENRLDLVNDLESRLTKMRDTLGQLASVKGFKDMVVASGDENIVSGTADPDNVKTGSWGLEVVRLPQHAAAMTNGFPDKDKAQIGTGYFRFKTPQGRKDVFIDGKNNTLEGAARAINAANVGVRASVIKDGDGPKPYKLLLSAGGNGEKKNISYPRLYFLDGDQDIYFEGSKEAQNGLIKVDGMEIEITDTTLNDLIPGVTLELKQAAPGRQVSLTVKEDAEAVRGRISEFVESANKVLSFIQQQNALSEKSDTTSTLGGDSILRTIESRLRTLIQNPIMGVEGPITRLSQLGVQFNRNGTLDFSQDVFDKQLKQDPAAVKNFFTGDGATTGFVQRLRETVGTFLDGGFGVIANRKRGLQENIRQIDSRIESKERALANREVQLRKKFAAMEETVAKMKSQGAALGQMGSGGGMLAMG